MDPPHLLQSISNWRRQIICWLQMEDCPIHHHLIQNMRSVIAVFNQGYNIESFFPDLLYSTGEKLGDPSP